jgi:hypothetical protein
LVSQEERLEVAQEEKPVVLWQRQEERLGVEQEGTLASPCERPGFLLEEKREERLEAERVVTQVGPCERREHQLVVRLGAGQATCL